MSRASQLMDSFQLARLLMIGDGKCGKSFYAAMAAKAGFNVLYFDGDVAEATISKMVKDKELTLAEADRIFIVRIPDQVKEGIGSDMSDTLMEFMNKSPIRWDVKNKSIVDRIKNRDPIENEVWEIRIPKLDGNWILVIDSWTAFTQSCLNWSAKGKSIDLGDVDAEERKQMRGVYQTANERATIMLEILRVIPCNVIVVAHPFEFTKRKSPDGKTVGSIKENEMIVEYSKMMPKSTTGNHSNTMAPYFTDIAWAEVNAMGNFVVDFRAKDSRLSGSHLSASKTPLNANAEGSFVSLVKALGGKLPTGEEGLGEALKILPRYDPNPPKTVIETNKSEPQIKGLGLGNLVKKV